MRRSVLAASAAAGLALAMSLTVAPGAGAAPAPDPAARVGQAPGPDKVTMPTRVRSQAAKGGGGSPISYHGGPVMVDPAVHVYYIWYGSWDLGGATTSVSKGSTILENLASNIGGSPYFKINTSYTNGSGARVTGVVTHAGSVSVGYPYGKSLGDADIASVVNGALATLGSDPAGVYFVLTSADVTETSGFVTKYCGWHNYATLNGTGIKYSFVGDATLLGLSSCAVQTSTSPNNYPGADAMASVIAHELEEATTDPALNAWFDGRGYENADKCAWTFGTTTTASNGSKYNVTFGGLNYLIQRNWSAKTQACGMS